jgi:hypothetical protein
MQEIRVYAGIAAIIEREPPPGLLALRAMATFHPA